MRLMKYASAIGAASALAIASQAAAEPLPAPTLSPLVLIDDEGKYGQDAQMTITLKQPVLDLAVAAQSSATFAPGSTVYGLPWLGFDHRTLLRKASFSQGDPRAISDTTYCSPLFTVNKDFREAQAEKGDFLPDEKNLRACFFDTDADATFDKMAITGTGSQKYRTPFDIAPIRYSENGAQPIGDMRWRLVAKVEDRTRSLGVLGMLSQRLVLQAQTNGATGRFDEVTTHLLGEGCAGGKIPIDTNLNPKRLPTTFSFGCAQLDIKAYDRKKRQLSYRIVEPMATEPVRMTVSFQDIYGGTIYSLD